MIDIISKIKKAGLVGRGGAAFPTAIKWQAVKDATGVKKFVVINGAEGEPGVLKDGYIIEHYPDLVLTGAKLALEYLRADKIYLYLKDEYYQKNKNKIIKTAKSLGLIEKLIIFPKPHDVGYIGGEESALLNIIEGQRVEPRKRPPFPTVSGLFGCPTLINNIETFYNVALVAGGQYKNDRFYTIGGLADNPGVYCLSANLNMDQVLKITKNYPTWPFFVQVGGDAAGIVLNRHQLDAPASGAASITIHHLDKHDHLKMFKYWLKFFKDSACGQCVPGREGTYRLEEMFKNKIPDIYAFQDILDDLETSAFCALCAEAPIPIKSYLKNIMHLRK